MTPDTLKSLSRTVAECAADASHLARCDAPPWLWYRRNGAEIQLAATRVDELPSRVGQGWSLLLAHPVPPSVPWSLYPWFIAARMADAALIPPGVALIPESA